MEWKETYRVQDGDVFHRAMFECDTLTAKGERIVVELTKCYNDLGDPRTIPNLWYKKGWIPKKLEAWWSVKTYVYDQEGNCYGRYNPQLKKGRAYETDLDWVFEATPGSARRLFAEIERRAFGKKERQ